MRARKQSHVLIKLIFNVVVNAAEQ
jgi:hypothetical protein